MPPKGIVSKPTAAQRAGAPPPGPSPKPPVSGPPKGAPASVGKSPAPAATKSPTSGGFDLEKIKAIEAERKARRAAATNAKVAAVQKAQAYKDAGIVGDVDFIEMIQVWINAFLSFLLKNMAATVYVAF